MSLSEFQRAVAEFAASPRRCARGRADFDTQTRDFTLTARERRRLRAILNDPAMSVNCMLYRVNRMTPLLSVLPLTCGHLARAIPEEFDEFWGAHPDAMPQFGAEARRLISWLEQRVTRRAIPAGPFLDAARFELAAFELLVSGIDGTRTVEFRHDPLDVLTSTTIALPLDQPIWIQIKRQAGEVLVSPRDVEPTSQPASTR
jgi:hypothetical protein